MIQWYILEGKTPKATDMLTAAQHFERPYSRQVALDKIGDVSISTVFLGFDHRMFGEGPPILFETMIFGGDHDQYQERYCTWDEAEAGHASAVALVKGERANCCDVFAATGKSHRGGCPGVGNG